MLLGASRKTSQLARGEPSVSLEDERITVPSLLRAREGRRGELTKVNVAAFFSMESRSGFAVSACANWVEPTAEVLGRLLPTARSRYSPTTSVRVGPLQRRMVTPRV
jgi:hypothetical protein